LQIERIGALADAVSPLPRERSELILVALARCVGTDLLDATLRHDPSADAERPLVVRAGPLQRVTRRGANKLGWFFLTVERPTFLYVTRTKLTKSWRVGAAFDGVHLFARPLAETAADPHAIEIRGKARSFVTHARNAKVRVDEVNLFFFFFFFFVLIHVR
jgi:hypothetical protein